MKSNVVLNAGVLVGVIACCAGSALGQLTVSQGHKFCWAENVGWLNWRDAEGGASGVRLLPRVLMGRVWSENLGWITVGDGAPTNGTNYANVDGSDCGINVLTDDRLGGLAWSENAGWINFGPFSTLPAIEQARLDRAASRLRGFAWGENLGWINLGDDTHFVGFRCAADFNDDGVVDLFDYLDFVAAFASEDPIADFNVDGVIDFFDYLDFVAVFASGC